MKTDQFQVIRIGRWRSHSRPGYVRIIRQDWDYYHEEFYDEPPDLNEDGFAFYAIYGSRAEVAECESRSQTFLSAADAIAKAEAMFEDVDWE